MTKNRIEYMNTQAEELHRLLSDPSNGMPAQISDSQVSPSRGAVYYVTQNIQIIQQPTQTPIDEGSRPKMRAQVILTPDEDGYIIAECPTLPGCISQGKSREEAIQNFKDAMQLYLKVRDEMGMGPALDVVEVEV